MKINNLHNFHIILRQYRVIAIILTGFFMWLTLDMWQWFKLHHDSMKEWAVGGFVSLALLAIGTVKWSLENFMKKVEKDEHDCQRLREQYSRKEDL